MSRHETNDMIDGFFARGGTIQKIPEAIPATADEIVEYLKSHKVNVEIVSSNKNDGKFTCDGSPIKLKGLVEIANRLRSKQHRPPYEIPSTPSR